MNDFFVYLFWPNPGNAYYSSPKAVALLIVCALMVAGGVVLSRWRKKQGDQVMRKLSKTWPSAAIWFGLIGLVLVVARVEQIQYIAMRILWVVWGVAIVLYVLWQIKRWR